MNTEEAVRDFLRGHCPRFAESASVTRVEGGLLNYVWRIVDDDQTAIFKATPPYLATAPVISLDDSRFLFEARALREFARGGAFEKLCSDDVWPPALTDVFEDERVLLMEDVGDVPNLSAWLERKASPDAVPKKAALLGEFVGKLHSTTFEDEKLMQGFNNLPIQVTRNRLQYQFVGPALKEWAHSNWKIVDERSRNAGRRFLSHGVCLTMGDLWPRSILMAQGGMRIIDWEFCHYGHPAQDVAHLSAHLWMLGHCAMSDAERKRFEVFNEHFLTSYLETVCSAQPSLIDTTDFDLLHRIHFGCEILARSVGHFEKNYLYDLPETHGKKKEAIERAVSVMTGETPFFS